MKELKERKRLRAKWSARVEDNPKVPRSKVSYDISKEYPASPFHALGYAANVADAADVLRCSFCGIVTDYATATFGKKSSSKRIQEVHFSDDGEVFIEEKFIHTQSQLSACPQCCNKIKPSVDKYGKVTKNNVKILSREDM